MNSPGTNPNAVQANDRTIWPVSNGLIVNTKVYQPTGDGAKTKLFWNSEFVNFIRNSELKPFLPNVYYDVEKQEAKFQLFEGTKEYCSTSRPMTFVSKESLAELVKAAEAFKKRVTASQGGLTSIFKLPNPTKNRELYRVGQDGRILVLWGCEKGGNEQIGYVDPHIAAQEISAVTRVRPAAEIRRGRQLRALFWLLPLLLLLGLCLWLWPKRSDQTIITETQPEKHEAEPGQYLKVEWSQVPNDYAPVLIRASAKKAGRIEIGPDFKVDVQDNQPVSQPFSKTQVVMVRWISKDPKINNEFRDVDVRVTQRGDAPPPPPPPPGTAELTIAELTKPWIDKGLVQHWLRAEPRLIGGTVMPTLSVPTWTVDGKPTGGAGGWDVQLGLTPGKHRLAATATEPGGRSVTGELDVDGGVEGRVKIDLRPLPDAEKLKQFEFTASPIAGSDGQAPDLKDARWIIQSRNGQTLAEKNGLKVTESFEPGNYGLQLQATDKAGKVYEDFTRLEVPGERGTWMTIFKTGGDVDGKERKYDLSAHLESIAGEPPALDDASVTWSIRAPNQEPSEKKGAAIKVSLAPATYSVSAKGKDSTGKDYQHAISLVVPPIHTDAPPSPRGLAIKVSNPRAGAPGETDYDLEAVAYGGAELPAPKFERVTWQITNTENDKSEKKEGRRITLNLTPGTYAIEAVGDSEYTDQKTLVVGGLEGKAGNLGQVEIVASEPVEEGIKRHYDLKAVGKPGANGELAPKIETGDWKVWNVSNGKVEVEKKGSNRLSHAFGRGVYEVQFETKDATGSLLEAHKLLTVAGDDGDQAMPPNAAIAANPLEQTPGGLVYELLVVPVAGSDGVEPEFKEATWDIQDQQGKSLAKKTGLRVNHTFPEGTYQLSVKAMDTAGRPYDASTPLVVKFPPPTPSAGLRIYHDTPKLKGGNYAYQFQAQLDSPDEDSPKLDDASVEWKIESVDGGKVPVKTGSQINAVLTPGARYTVAASGKDRAGKVYEDSIDLTAPEVEPPPPPVGGLAIVLGKAQPVDGNQFECELQAIAYGGDGSAAPKFTKVDWKVVDLAGEKTQTLQGEKTSVKLPPGSYAVHATGIDAQGKEYTDSELLVLGETRGIRILAGEPAKTADSETHHFTAARDGGDAATPLPPGDWMVSDAISGSKISEKKKSNSFEPTLKQGRYAVSVEIREGDGKMLRATREVNVPSGRPNLGRAILQKKEVPGGEPKQNMEFTVIPEAGDDGEPRAFKSGHWQFRGEGQPGLPEKDGIQVQQAFEPGNYTAKVVATGEDGATYEASAKFIVPAKEMQPGVLKIKVSSVDLAKKSFELEAIPEGEPVPAIETFTWSLSDSDGKVIHQGPAKILAAVLQLGKTYSATATGKASNGRTYSGTRPFIAGDSVVLSLDQNFVKEVSPGKFQYQLVLEYRVNGRPEPIPGPVAWTVDGKRLDDRTDISINVELSEGEHVIKADTPKNGRIDRTVTIPANPK